MSKIKLVVFDMAGTTVKDNKEVESCFSQACAQTGLVVNDNRILALQGYSKIEVFRMLWDEKIGIEHPEFEENVFTSYDYFCDILEHHYNNSPIAPTLHCLDTFKYLRENGIKIALTTGFYRNVCNIILEKLGWLNGLNKEYFNDTNTGIIDFSICSDEVFKGRPEPFMIFEAMKMFGITDPKEVINVGDTPADLESGKIAKVGYNLAVSNGTHSKEQLMAYENDGLIGDLSELKKYILQYAEI
jgi:phosphonatase-like hydrolase